jgi:hypothetical protein
MLDLLIGLGIAMACMVVLVVTEVRSRRCLIAEKSQSDQHILELQQHCIRLYEALEIHRMAIKQLQNIATGRPANDWIGLDEHGHIVGMPEWPSGHHE